MAIPLLEYAPSSQNQRVVNYEIPGDEQSRIYTSENLLSDGKKQELIWAGYRQIFNEQQILSSNRDKPLESQLKAGQITVRDFIRGLVLSETFRRRNYEPNSNYRFVEMCIQRILGRNVYSDREKLAWSIVLATKGLAGFIDDLFNSPEYLDNFGDDIVPYQRRRILPQRTEGELSFARMPRYGADYRSKLEALGYFAHKAGDYYGQPYYPPQQALLVGKIITIGGAILLGLMTLAVALSAWGLISL